MLIVRGGIALRGFSSSSVAAPHWLCQCWLGLSALLRIAASLLGLSNGHLRLGSVPVWLSIREGASVDCDLERVMLIGQPGIDNPGPEAGAQTAASSS